MQSFFVIAIWFRLDVAAVYILGSSTKGRILALFPLICETRRLLSYIIAPRQLLLFSVDMSVEVTTGVFDPRNYKVMFNSFIVLLLFSCPINVQPVTETALYLP